MQDDMHYYGTLAMAITAGIPRDDAETIAYAAQFVDDSTGYDSSEHEDHGLLYGISTAHHPLQSFLDRMGAKVKEGTEEQRKIWIPFHFFPGAKGKVLSEKLLCVKNGDLAQEMLENNLEAALKKPYGIALIGITAHVYMDTFSHYGFSGIASSFNQINSDAISIIKKPKTKTYIEEKFKQFIAKLTAKGAQAASKSLGHAGAATYPDRPYLKWKVSFARPRPDGDITSMRDNRNDFLEGCKCLHAFFSKFAKAKYKGSGNHTKFDDIEKRIRSILSQEVEKKDRILAWKVSGLINDCTSYNPEIWENEKMMFSKYSVSEDGINTKAYRFHQAATYHRYYVLKELLPNHGIAVY